MKGSEPAALAVFGDLEADLWGVVIGGERPHAAVAGLADANVELTPVDLDTGDDDVWLLSGPRLELRIERAEAATAGRDEGAELHPCRVSGAAELATRRREFDVGGMRTELLPSDRQAASLRIFAAWFPAGHEIGLRAARPRGAKGHDRDSIAVAARGEEHPLVIDPRLSTTYDPAGAPRRVGLELWLGDDPEGDLWPRRVAGLWTGSTVSGSGLSAHALECVSRGEPGAGVYVLVPA